MTERVLLATINYDHPQTGVRRAFQDIFGPENVQEFDYLGLGRSGNDVKAVNRMFVEAALKFRPSWVWMQLQETNVLDSISVLAVKRAIRDVVVTHWTGDCRKEVSQYLASICRACDVTFLSSVGQVPLFKARGARRAEYLQIGLDWDEDVMGLAKWRPSFRIPEVVLCGNFYGANFPGTEDRIRGMGALREAHLDVGVVGGGDWPAGTNIAGKCGVKEQYHVWTRAKVALNINHFNDIELYYSDRQLIAMASGTPVVARYVPGIEKEFTPDRDCLFYREPAELVEKVKRLLAEPERRRAIGRAGREAVIRAHTWWHRVLSAYGTVESLRRSQ